MKFNRNKGICPDLIRIVLDDCIYDYDDLPLFYLEMNLPPCQLQDLTCLSLFLLCLEFIIRLIESAFTSLLITNPDALLHKCFEAFNDIHVRIESIICEEGPPLWGVTNHLQRVLRNRDA